MAYRTWIGVGATLAFAAIAGVTTSQQQPPTPAAATQVDLARDRADNAALAQARQDPLAARIQGVLNQNQRTQAVLRLAQASPVPVLAPPDPTLLAGARLYNGDRVYQMVVERGAAVIEITGWTKAFQAADGQAVTPTDARPPRVNAATRAPARVPAGAGAVAARARAQASPGGMTNVRTERTEYGTDVTFSRFGAAYNVSFICEGQGAAGCSEAEAVAFASSLVLIGGGS